MSEIKTSLFIKSSNQEMDCPDPDRPEFAFIGRSNVGKSSLINSLTNQKKLAKVSGTPGKTQLINHFLIDDSWYMVDLPGYGYAQVSKTEKNKWKKMTLHYLEKRPNLTCVFVLVDSRLEPQKIDLDFIRYLGENQIPLALIFTKVDKLGINKSQRNISHFKKALKKEWETLPEVFSSSSVSGHGKEEIIKYIQDIHASIKT